MKIDIGGMHANTYLADEVSRARWGGSRVTLLVIACLTPLAHPEGTVGRVRGMRASQTVRCGVHSEGERERERERAQ